MTLADEVEAGPPADRTAQRRKIDVWLGTLSERDRAGAEKVLANESWRHSAVQALFKRNGLDVSETQISRYRKDRYGTR